MRSLLILVFLCLAGTAYISGQPVIKGIVTEKGSNEPLPGVNVYLPDYSAGTVTGANGHYVLNGLHKGEFIVKFSFIGYKTVIKTVELDDAEVILNVVMQPAVIQGEEVVITGTFAGAQHDNVMKISTLQARKIEFSGTPSFIETMRDIPGVEIISKGPGIGTPVIRGLSLNNILVMNNGIPLENFQFSENHPFMIDDNGVGQVEVIKGPASLLYGSGAVGGVINIIKKPPLPEGRVEGDFSMKYFSNTSGLKSSLGINGTNNGVVWGISGGVNSNEDYFDGNNIRVPNSRFNRENLKLNTGLIRKNGTFRLFYDYNRDKLGLTIKPSIPLVSDNGRKNEIWYQDLTNHLLSLISKIFIGNTKLDITLGYQINNRKLKGSDLTPVFTLVDMKQSTFTYRVASTLKPAGKLKIIAGIQGLSRNNKNYEAPEHVVPDANVNEFSVFSVLQYSFTTHVMLEGGLRYDIRNINVPGQPAGGSANPGYINPFDKKYNNVSGSLGGVYNINEKTLLRFNLASAFRSPNLAELTQDGVHGTRYEQGNRELNSQQSLEGDLSFHLHSDHTTIDLSGFYNNIFNYIYIAPSGDTTSTGMFIYKYGQQNSSLYGGEALLHVHPHPLDWLHLKSTWSYVIGRTADGGYLPFIPAQKVKLELELQKKKWKSMRNLFVRFGSNFVLSQTKVSPPEAASPAYQLFNFGIGSDMTAGNKLFTFGFFIDNIFNEVYLDHLSTLKDTGMNDPGRNFSVMLKLRF